jgi:Na+/proline symporter
VKAKEILAARFVFFGGSPRRFRLPRLRTATYGLAISVYCTAWTFFGSVGLAANRRLEFMTI